MAKTIFVLLDACQYEAGSLGLGFLEHLIDWGQGAKYKVWGELPSISRPMYETSLTGLPVYRHGITNNTIVRRSRCDSVFSLCKGAGLSTAAAAYSWMAELYNKAPFDPLTDRYQFSSGGLIDNGIFYSDDFYPDTHLFMDGEYLRSHYGPDFLVIHSMGIDAAGHREGCDSTRYHMAIATANEILATVIPLWTAQGYQVVVTGDHGMNFRGMHGGTAEDQRAVPLYLFGAPVKPGRFTDTPLSQLGTAPLLCRLLGIAPGPEMTGPQEVAFL